MSTAIAKNFQVGSDSTATNNFTIRQPTTPDGTVRIANGNSGTTTDLVTVTSAGNVGIGTSSPRVVSGYTSLGVNGSGGGLIDLFASGTRLATFGADAAGATVGSITSIPLVFNTNNTEKARITSGGDLLVGTTTAGARTVIARPDNDVVFRVYNSLTSGTTFDLSQVITAQTAGTGYNLLRLFTSNGGAAQFAVRADGVVFAQNTTIQSISDARVKENVRDADDGLETILGLRPVRFDFKEGFGNNRKNQLGFIAQEVEAVFSDAVDVAGEKDENGDPYKSVGPSALVPVLVKAIQELKAELDSVKTELALLKGTA